MSEEKQQIVVGVPRETFPGERRVALVPSTVGALTKAGMLVGVESAAGEQAGFADQQYLDAGGQIINDRAEVFSKADVILQVRAGGGNPEAGQADLEHFRDGQLLIAGCDPLSEPERITAIGQRGVLCFALEMLPRITRAQSMDILSSMATIAGYKAVLLAADHLPRMFPMLMTAAGTVAPARVLIVGAGVAGLQAIATAKRLGAVVFGYDIRPAVREQVESLGGKFVELELETGQSETAGGYAREMDEDFYRRQRELMTKVVADCDVVITTAAIPGKQAPILVTTSMVEAMKAGSAVIDIAAERGGNCELTRPGETVIHHGVSILGPLNLSSTIPYHASEMYSKNISTFLLNLIKDGRIDVNVADEIVSGTLMTRGGEVVHPRVREILGMAPLEQPESEADQDEPAQAGSTDGAEAS